MSLVGILIGLLNCIVLALILVLIGAVVLWVLAALGWPIPQNIQKIYLGIVALITLICFISLIAGAPMVHFFHYSALTSLASA
jgi:hypothetical protein